jgi:hypothetical protein
MPIVVISPIWRAGHKTGHGSFRKGMFGAAAGNPETGAAERVCRIKKAQSLVLRESRDSPCAVMRLLAVQIALAFHCGINLYFLP